MINTCATGSVYVTSRLTKNGWIIRILDENNCLIEVQSDIEPIMMGDARFSNEPPRPTKTRKVRG
jgi:hypothetical protein